jgi:hypothetical protein
MVGCASMASRVLSASFLATPACGTCSASIWVLGVLHVLEDFLGFLLRLFLGLARDPYIDSWTHNSHGVGIVRLISIRIVECHLSPWHAAPRLTRAA